MASTAADVEQRGEPAVAAPWLDFADAILSRAVKRARGGGTGAEDSAADEMSLAELDGLVAAARTRLHDSLRIANSFSTIVSNADLTLDEAELLAVLMACESALHRQRLVAFLQDDAMRTRLMLQTVAMMFDSDHAGVVAASFDAGLQRAALIEVDEEGPWGQHVLAVAPGVMWAIAGETAPDPRLPWKVRMVQGHGPSLDSFVVVTGRDRLRREQAGLACASGDRFIVCSAPDSPEGWAAVVREATLSGAGIVIEADEPLAIPGRRWIERTPHLTWVLSSRSAPDLADLPVRPRREVEASAEPATDDEWRAAFGDDQARSHPIAPEQLDPVGMAFLASGNNLDAAVRRLVGSRLERLAQRIRPTLSWDDLVLSPERLAQLHQIADVFRCGPKVYDEWGFAPGSAHGLVVLFSGPSGAGKTLSAEVIANELKLEIFKLEMSAVVSKYIGETEKNLEEVFDAASAGNLVLFFDEADALFGKRSEVKDARDRYANIEVSYLLQRLERYPGIVVLATNFEKNLDEAFLRRIHARVDFILPGEPERLAIWKLNIPAAAPVADDVDLDVLAKKFTLSGASIKNAVIHAAFLAAASGTPITMRHLVLGVVRDFRKFGKLVRPEDFGELMPLVADVAL
ncbi:MAG TPA: ATP-binding protein [Ilumatobacteraceae bacterium]